MVYDLIIVGAGPSGIFAAINANPNLKILILEKNKEILKKFLITGGGDKANITNDKPIKDMIKDDTFINGKFMYGPLTFFGPKDILNFLKENQIEYKYKNGTRVHLDWNNTSFRKFCLEKIMSNKNIFLSLNSNVENVEKNNNIFSVFSNDNKYCSNNVLISTGGKSFFGLGSTGDGFDIAKKFGHTIEDLFPIGNGIKTQKTWINELSGTSIHDVKINIFLKDKLLKSEKGNLMITHYGLGGPIIRRISHFIYFYKNDNPYLTISIMSNQDFENEIKNNHYLRECFKDLTFNFKKKMYEYINIEKSQDLKNISKKQINDLKSILVDWRFDNIESLGVESSIATGGGIKTSEINPKNMESKKIKGLFFAGEVLSTNALTGGINLTFCFSTSINFIKYINKIIL